MLFTNYGNAIQQGYHPLWILHIVGIVYINVSFFLANPFFSHIENKWSGFFMDNRYMSMHILKKNMKFRVPLNKYSTSLTMVHIICFWTGGTVWYIFIIQLQGMVVSDWLRRLSQAPNMMPYRIAAQCRSLIGCMRAACVSPSWIKIK